MVKGITAINILTINLGSTSTKLGLFENECCIHRKTVCHPQKELSQFETIKDQYQMRKQTVLSFVSCAQDIGTFDLQVIVSRGGILCPIPGGIYLIDEIMVNDLDAQGKHPCNLGGIIAFELASEWGGLLALTVDPPSTDELISYARLSGIPQIKRRSRFHSLNQKATARDFAKKLGKEYENLNLIIAHLGGGISVAAHKRGNVIDVNDALNGDGPFSPERSGGLPAWGLVELCYSGKYSRNEIYQLLSGKGGLLAYLNTQNGEEVERRVYQGDDYATLVYRAMAYQISKEIGAMAVTLRGNVDGIGLTGGLACSKMLTDWITEDVNFIAPVKIFPGEHELHSLAQGAVRVLKGIESVKTYSDFRKGGTFKC